MNWKCFILGHKSGEWNILSEMLGTYETICNRCGKVEQGQSYDLVRIAAMHKRDSMQRLAWNVLEAVIPDTFHKEPGKTRHCLSYSPNGQITFAVDLGEHPLNVLDIYRDNLCKVEPEFKTWNIRPLLKLVKD